MTTRSRIVVFLLALCGVAMLLFATTQGIGLSPDSSAYIGAARELLQGLCLGSRLPDGHCSPMVHYAPLFPMLLAAIGLLGIDPLDGARWLNSVLFASNILLSGHIIKRETASTASALFGATLLLISLPMLEIHSMAWSEPTFVFFSLLALLCLSQYAGRGGDGYLVAAAAAIGLGVLSRYAGLVLIGAGIGAIIIGSRHPYRDTGRDCGVFAAVSCLVSSVSFGRNWMVAGMLTDRAAVLHPVGLAQLQSGVGTIAGWLWLDAGLPRLTLAIVAVGAFALVLRSVVQRLRHPAQHAQRLTTSSLPSPVARTALIFITGYGLFLLVVISFFDAAIPLDDRVLSPIFAWALIGGVCGAHRLATHPPRGRWLRPLLVIAGVWLAVAQVLQLVPWMVDAHRNGQGYASPYWRQLKILALVRALPLPTRIFSNGDDAIYLLTGRLAERLPERMSLFTMEKNDDYEADLLRLRRQLTESNGVIVCFSIGRHPNLVSSAELEARLTLRTLYAAADGTIYAVQD